MLRHTIFSLVVTSTAGVAETTWLPPEFNPLNKVYVASQEHLEVMGMKELVVLGDTGDRQLTYQAPPEFWNAIIAADTEGLIDRADSSPDIGLVFIPPIYVMFPTPKGIQEVRSQFEPDRFAAWEDTDQSVWVQSSHEFISPGAKMPPEFYVITFKLDPEGQKTPGVCHARQVVRVLYTGDADMEELSDCLLVHSSE